MGIIKDYLRGQNNLMILENHFTSFGILAKNTTLDYTVEDCEHWVLFRNENNKLSFMFHDLEVGLTEASYWRATSALCLACVFR